MKRDSDAPAQYAVGKYEILADTGPLYATVRNVSSGEIIRIDVTTYFPADEQSIFYAGSVTGMSFEEMLEFVFTERPDLIIKIMPA